MPRIIERIGFISPTAKGDILEWVILGYRFWDLGICEKIVQSGDKSYRASFKKDNNTFELEIDDSIRRVYKNGSEPDIPISTGIK